MRKYKEGDRVMMVSDHIPRSVPVGTEGTVAGTYPEYDMYDYRVKFDGRYTYAIKEDQIAPVETIHKDETLGRWLVGNDEGGQSVLVEYAPGKYWWEDTNNGPLCPFDYYKRVHKVTELHLAEGDTTMDADKALEITKMEMGLCGEFDTAVAEAKAMTDVPLDTALELVALRRDQKRVFKHYLEVKKRKELEIPEIGRWIKATAENGETHVFEVTMNASLSEWAGIRLASHPALPGTYICILKPGARGGMGSHWIVEWEYTKKPYQAPEAPKQGEYVRLTMADKTTLTGEVNMARHGGGEIYIHVDGAGRWIPLTEKKYDRIRKEWGPGYIITDIEKIQRPWKVGDVAPAGTVLGKRWLGRRVDGEKQAGLIVVPGDLSSSHDRKIEWIED